MSKVKKVIRDGKVAVLISLDFGAGWSTWNEGFEKTLLFDEHLVKMVEQGRQDEITDDFMFKNYGLDNICLAGVADLKIEWLPIGTRFYVEDYDGSETIITEESFLTA